MSTTGTSATFSLFGIGQDGIPDRIEQMLADGGDRQIAQYIESYCRKRGRASDEIRTMALLMAEYHGLPPHVLRSLALCLDLISPDTRRPLPAASARAALGLPMRVKKFREFLELAGRSALALALIALRDHPPATALPENPSPAYYFVEAYNRRAALGDLLDRANTGQIVLRDDALHKASAQLWMQQDDGTLVEAGRRDAVARSTIKTWRALPEFRHIITEVGGRYVLSLNPPASLSDKAIREIAMKTPVEDILSFAGDVRTVWNAAPEAVAKARTAVSQVLAT